jgi:hypothetical protein
LRWQGPANWKEDYSNINKLSQDEIARRRADFDKAKIAAKNSSDKSSG